MMATTILGASALAVLAPLAVSLFGSSNSDNSSWDAERFVIRPDTPEEKQAGIKAPVMLQKKAKQEAATKQTVVDNKKKQEEQQQFADAAKSKAQTAATMLPAQYQTMQLTANGSSETIAASGGEIYLGNLETIPSGNGGATGSVGRTTMFLESAGSGNFSVPLINTHTIKGNLTLPGGRSSIFGEGKRVRVTSVGAVSTTGSAIVHWTSDTAGELSLEAGFHANNPVVAYAPNTVVRLDVYEEPTASMQDAVERGSTKRTKDQKESFTNILVSQMEGLEQEMKKDVGRVAASQSRNKFQQHIETGAAYGAVASVQAAPNMERADITCAQATRMIRDGFPVNHASASWQNDRPTLDTGLNLQPRTSKPVRLHNMGGDQSVHARRFAAHPVTELGRGTRSNVQRNPAKIYGVGNTKYARGGSDANAVSNYRSNHVARPERNEVPGMVGREYNAMRADVHGVNSGFEKRTRVGSTARVRGDKVQLHRRPNAEASHVALDVRDSQMSDRTREKRRELPIQASAMPSSISTSDFRRRTDRGARVRKPFNGNQESAVRLRRLNTVPGMMLNRMNNDGNPIITHALQNGSKAAFKYRAEFGENTNPIPTGIRGHIAKNAMSARQDRRLEMVDNGMVQNAAPISRDEFVRRDVTRPHTDIEVLRPAEGKIATNLRKNEAWAAGGADARGDTDLNLRADKRGEQGGKVVNSTPFEYRERTPNQETDLPEQRTTTESSYVPRDVRDPSKVISEGAHARRGAAVETSAMVTLEPHRGVSDGAARSIDQTYGVGIQGAGNATIPHTMASVGTEGRGATLERAERKSDNTQTNTRIHDDVADVQGQLRFVKPTESRGVQEVSAGVHVPSRETTERRGGWDSLALNHTLEGSLEGILPRRDPYMESVPRAPFSQGFSMENEQPEVVDGKLMFSQHMPTNVRPGEPREFSIRTLDHVFRERDE